MKYEGAELKVTFWGNEEKTFHDVTALVDYPEPKPAPAADGMGGVTRAGTARLRLPEFHNWRSVLILEIDGDRFEVNDKRSQPQVKGEWLEYPVSVK